MTLSEVLSKAEAKGVFIPKHRDTPSEYAASMVYLAIVQWLAERGIAVAKHDNGKWYRCGVFSNSLGWISATSLDTTDFRTAVLLTFDRELDNSRDAREGGGE